MVKKKKKILKKIRKKAKLRKIRKRNIKKTTRKKGTIKKVKRKKATRRKVKLRKRRKMEKIKGMRAKTEEEEEAKLAHSRKLAQIEKITGMPPIYSSEEMRKKAKRIKRPLIKEVRLKEEVRKELKEREMGEEKVRERLKGKGEEEKENEEISEEEEIEKIEKELPEEEIENIKVELPEELEAEKEKERRKFLHGILAPKIIKPITPVTPPTPASKMKPITPIKKEEKLRSMLPFTEKVPETPTETEEEREKAEERIKIEQISKKESEKGVVLEKYSIEIDKAKVKVEIKRGASGISYNLYVPEIGVATASLLDDIRNELVSVTTISMQEILDPTALKDIKKRFMQIADELLKKKLPTIESGVEEFLIGKLMQDMLGLGEIEFLVNDPGLEEVVIPSSKEPIRVYHKKYGWLLTNLRIAKEGEIVNYSNIIARRVGRQITVLTPLLDAHLVTGDRVNAVLYPISTKGNTITIRKFARDPYTIIDLITNKTCSLEIATLLWLAVEYEMNVLISGGTASGKTVLLNACMPFIPPNHRIVSVEDTRELMLPDFLYWTPLVTRTPNPEGKGEVNMLDLLVNSLRMRPDRIVLGEMRRKEEAMVLFEAMHTGHSVYATVHADSASETISRLTNPPLSIPANLLRAVNLNVVMFRDRRKGIRRISQVAEFQTSEDRAEANIIYRLIPEEDKMIRHSESSRFFEDLSRNTGMTQDEMNKNLEEKQKILSWLIQNKIRGLNELGKVMNIYYTDREKLKTLIKKNDVKGVIGR